MEKSRKVLGLFSGIITICILVIPLFFFGNLVETAKNASYFGYFLANYLGLGTYTLPFLVKVLNPILLILIGGFGSTLDEFFAWYAGNVSEELDRSKKFHNKIQSIVERYGLMAIFTLGLLPLPGLVYAISGFAAGHFKIPFHRFFLTNLLGKLIRTTILVVALLMVL